MGTFLVDRVATPYNNVTGTGVNGLSPGSAGRQRSLTGPPSPTVFPLVDPSSSIVNLIHPSSSL